MCRTSLRLSSAPALQRPHAAAPSTPTREGGPQAQVGVAYEEIDAVETFKVCNTSRKKGMRDVAREVVISPCTCLFALLGF